MADEIIQDPLEAANYLLRQYRDNPDFEFTQEEASLVHNAYQGGVSFFDSKPVMDEASTSSFLRSQDESDPSFIASEEEFSILKATEPGAISRIGAGMTGAAEYFGPVIKEGIPELIETASMREPRPGDPSLPATLLEAGARGTVDLGTMAVGASKFIEKAPFMAAGALGMQDDYKSYLNQKTIDQNYQMQAIDKMNAERAQGKSIIGLPEGTFAPKAAEAASMVLDPTLAVPFIGPGAKATGVAGRGLGATTKIAGGIETAARATGGAIDLGVEKVGQGIQRVLPGVTAPKTAGAIATGAAAIGIPGAFPIGAKIAGVRAGAEVVERGAQAVRIAGEEAMTGPSRMTVMERVAKNQKNPEWLRKAANTSIVSSPITQGAAELGLETGKGAVKSAAVGAGLGYVASGGEEEGIGGGLVIGGGLGTIGGAVKGVATIPAKKALAKQGDVNRLFARQADLGLDVNKIADYVRKDNRPFLDAATLQMMAPDVQVEFHGRDSFMMPENAGINAAGVVKAVPDKSGTTRLLVNMDDMRSSGDTVKHEIMHAIMKSPAINKAEGRMAVMSEYGEEGLRRFGNEYARKLLEGERQGRGTPTEAEVRAKANELREGSQRSEPGAGDLDWIADEVLAEQFVGEFRGKDLDSLRRKTLPGTDLLSLQEGFLAPVGRLLNKFGIDTTGPKPTNIDTLFKENPLVPSKQLRELTARWFRDRDKYLDGLEKAEKQKDVTLVPGPGNRNLANNPAIKFTRNRKTNLEENDFAVKFPDGTVRAKDPASILAVDKARVADVAKMYDPNAVLERGSPEFGVKIQSDGKPYVGGNTLPEGFFNLDSFNDFTKEVAKTLQDSRQEGKTFSVWYQKIGTGEDGSWAQSVKRGLGNIKVGQSEIAFLGWRLSKAGNILAQAVDISALRGRMLDFARSGKGRINEVWGGDLASYEKDVMQYLDNHANERPGETGIGIDKRNAINYLFGITNIANKNANPMYAAEGRPPGSLVKSYRLDRIANSRDTGRTGFFFDYQKQAANLAPGERFAPSEAPAKTPLTDKEFTATLRKAAGDPEKNLKLRLARREGTGVAKNKLTEFTTRDGKPIVIGSSAEDGGKPFSAWQRETNAWLTSDEIGKFRQWYDNLPQEFRGKFDEDPGRYMVAWLAGQQNASPGQALGIMFRAMDRIDGIISVNEKTGKLLKGGLADDKVEAILRGKTPEGGYGPKLTDFADAGLGRSSRSFMGDNPQGGQPFVADVHTGRDSGHVDQQTLTRLISLSEDNNLFMNGKPVSLKASEFKVVSANGKTTKVPEKVVIQQPGEKSSTIFADMRGSPGANQYEGISVWGNKLTDFLNEQNWEGGNWKPAQAQAVGWMRILRQYGLNEGTSEGSFRTNTRDIYAEVNYSSGAVLPKMFPEFGKLTPDQQASITSSVIEKTVNDLVGIIGGSLRKVSITSGKGYFGGEASPAMMIRAMGSKEVADMLTVGLAYVSEQTMAMSVINGQGGKASNGIYIRKSDRTPFTQENLNALAKIDQIKGMNAFPIDGYDTIFIADAGKDFKPKGFTEEKAISLGGAMSKWAQEQGLGEVDIKPTPCKIESYGQSYKDEPSGNSFLRVFDARGGGERIRRLIQYRGEYVKNLRKAFAEFAPEQPIRKEDPEIRSKITEAQKEILLEVELNRRRLEKIKEGEKSGLIKKQLEAEKQPSVGININDSSQDFTGQILAGEKTIETRDSDSLRPYVGKRVGIIRTGVGKAELVGYATIGEPVIYKNQAQFKADQGKHLVASGSEFDIKRGGVKYGYPISDVEKTGPTPVKSQGIVARQLEAKK